MSQFQEQQKISDNTTQTPSIPNSFNNSPQTKQSNQASKRSSSAELAPFESDHSNVNRVQNLYFSSNTNQSKESSSALMDDFKEQSHNIGDCCLERENQYSQEVQSENILLVEKQIQEQSESPTSNHEEILKENIDTDDNNVFESSDPYNDNTEDIQYQNIKITSEFNEEQFKESILNHQGLKLIFWKGVSPNQQLKRICLQLQNFQTLQRPFRFILEASGMEWNRKEVIPIWSSLITFPNLISLTLNLSNNKVNNLAIKEIGKFIKKAVFIRFWEIDLSQNQTLDGVGHLLIKKFTHLKNIEKIFINLNFTNQTNECPINAAECIKNNKKTLKQVNFQFRQCYQISNDSIRVLLESVLEISTLIVFGIGIDLINSDNGTAKLLIEILKKHNRLKNLSLNLSQCNFHEKRLIEIARCLENIYSIQKLELGLSHYRIPKIFDSFTQQLKNKDNLVDLILDFNDNQLDNSNLSAFNKIMITIPKLSTLKLYLSNNKQFDQSAQNLADILKDKKIKGILEMKNCNIPIPSNIVQYISNHLNMKLSLNQK